MGAEIKRGDYVRVTIEGPWDGRPSRVGEQLDGERYEYASAPGDKVWLEKIEPPKPPVEYFKPGDRIRRLPTDYTKPYEITLGDGGYIHHGASDSWLNLATGQSFTSEYYELVVR